VDVMRAFNNSGVLLDVVNGPSILSDRRVIFK
jgi:hypothetical protein